MYKRQEERVSTVIKLALEAMKMMNIENPRIAVAGLNAHSSENGLFGDEESKAISPAISKARKAGINVEGPVPPDTVFVKALAGQYAVSYTHLIGKLLSLYVIKDISSFIKK